jgi:ABC-type branched-subunit amino acid transport system substrate-binding protein
MRMILFAVSAILTALTFPCDAQETFRIGGLVSFSGAYSLQGVVMRQAVELAVEERGGKILGRPIVIKWVDTETKPQVAVQQLTRILSEGVDVIFGGVSSSETIAMMKPIEQRKVIHLVTASSDNKITGENKTRYTFRTSDTIELANRIVGEFIKERKFKKLYAVASDVGVLRDSMNETVAFSKKLGIEVVGVDVVPLDTTDYSVVVDKMIKSEADAVVAYLGGAPAITFVKQAAQVDLPKKATLFGPVLMDEAQAAAVGDASIGVYSVLRYQFGEDNPANHRFVEAFRKKYNAWPNEIAGEAYDGASWLFDVIEKTGVWDREKWVDAFETSVRENSVQGRKTMRKCDHQATQIGLFGVVAKGQPPLPEYYMKIEKTYPESSLFDPCKVAEAK